MISESEIDGSFRDGQFFLDDLGTPFLDWNKNGGGIILFISNDIPAKVVSIDDRPIEISYIDLNFLKKMSLLNWIYNPKRTITESYLALAFKRIDSLSSKYDNVVFLGGFNSYMEDFPMKTFCEIYKLRNLIKELSCFKNPEESYM